MHRAFAMFLLALASAPAVARGDDPLKVVATIPDLADIVTAIGGERVDVTTIARGRENLHLVTPKPSHLIALNKADAFVQIGLSLESAFVPGLLESSRNPRIQPGSPGFVNCSQGFDALDVPASVSRKSGDVHPHGNPHMNLDPRAGRHIATRVLEALAALDPRSKDAYRARFDAYAAKLDVAEKRWAALGEAWRGARMVVYHKEYDYIAAAYGIAIAGSIEERPGIPPGPNHIAALVETMKREKVGVVVTAAWSNNRTTAEVAQRGGARLVELPNQCGGLSGTSTWIDMMDVLHTRLADAFRAASVGR